MAIDVTSVLMLWFSEKFDEIGKQEKGNEVVDRNKFRIELCGQEFFKKLFYSLNVVAETVTAFM